MPHGPISVEQVVHGQITFFSLDTDLIQSAGFDFGAGALHQLPKQLPKSMRLQLSDVVVQEIVRHRIEPVREAILGFKKASQALARLSKTPMAPIDQSFAALAVDDVAAVAYRNEVSA